MAAFTLRLARIEDLDVLAPLFDHYRQFYQQPADLQAARDFLSARFQHHESVIVLALSADGDGLGFAQLYPLFSSTRMARIYLLNDLFVVPQARRSGVARALLDAAASHARALGAIGLSLSTAHDNLQAQRLYESLGWQYETEFRDYNLALT